MRSESSRIWTYLRARLTSDIWPGRQPFRPELPCVLVVSHDATLSGAPIVAQNLALHLSRRFNVVVLSLHRGPMIKAFQDSALEVWTPKPSRNRGRQLAATVRRLTATYPFHFAILNSSMSYPVGPPLARAGIRLITLMHEFAANLVEYAELAELFALSHAVVFEARMTEEDAGRRIGHAPGTLVKVIPQGRCLVPDVGQRSSEMKGEPLTRRLRPPGSEKAFLVLAIGNIHHRKGPDLFIQIAAIVKDRAPDIPWRFVWIGGELSADQRDDLRLYLSDQISRSGLSDCVSFLPPTPDVETAYRGSDALLLSSRLEPFSNVAIDSLAHGLPVFCFEQAAGVAELMEEADLARHSVAPYLDIDDLADKMITLARDPSRRAAYAEVARRVVKDRLQMEDYANRLVALVDEPSPVPGRP